MNGIDSSIRIVNKIYRICRQSTANSNFNSCQELTVGKIYNYICLYLWSVKLMLFIQNKNKKKKFPCLFQMLII